MPKVTAPLFIVFDSSPRAISFHSLVVVFVAQLLCLLPPPVHAVCPPTTLNVGGVNEMFANCNTPAVSYTVASLPAGVVLVLDGFVCRSIRLSPALSGNTIVIRNTIFTGTGVIFASAINGLDLELQNVTLAADIPTPTSLLDFQGATRNLDLKASSLSVDRGSSGKYPRNLISCDFAPALDASTLYIDGFTFERPMDGSDVVGQFSFLSLRNQNTVTSGVNVTVENLRISIEKSDAINIFDTHKWKLLDWTMTLRSSSIELLQPAGNSTLSNAIFHINSGTVNSSTMVAENVTYDCRTGSLIEPKNIYGALLYFCMTNGLNIAFKDFQMFGENRVNGAALVSANNGQHSNISIEVLGSDLTFIAEKGEGHALNFYQTDAFGVEVVVERLQMNVTAAGASSQVVSIGQSSLNDANIHLSDVFLYQLKTQALSASANGVVGFWFMQSLHRAASRFKNVTYVCEGNGVDPLSRMTKSPPSCSLVFINRVFGDASSVSIHADGFLGNLTTMASAVVNVNNTNISDGLEVVFKDTTVALEGFGAAALVALFAVEVAGLFSVSAADIRGSLHSILHTTCLVYVGKSSAVREATFAIYNTDTTVTEAYDPFIGMVAQQPFTQFFRTAVVQSASIVTVAASSSVSTLLLSLRNVTATVTGTEYAGLLDIHDKSSASNTSFAVSGCKILVQTKPAQFGTVFKNHTAVVSVSKHSDLAGDTTVVDSLLTVVSGEAASAVATSDGSDIEGSFTMTGTTFSASCDDGPANFLAATAGPVLTASASSSTLKFNGSKSVALFWIEDNTLLPTLQRTLSMESTIVEFTGNRSGAAIEMLRDTWSGSLTLTNVSVDSEELAGSFALLGVTPGASVPTSPTFSVALRDVRLLNGLMAATKLSGAGGGSGAVGVQLSTSCVVRYPGPRLVRAEDYALVPGQFVSYSPLSLGEQVDQCGLMTPTLSTEATPSAAATPAVAATPTEEAGPSILTKTDSSSRTAALSPSSTLSVDPVTQRCTKSSIRVAAVHPATLIQQSPNDAIAIAVEDSDSSEVNSNQVATSGLAIVVELTNTSGVWFRAMGASQVGLRCEGASDVDRELCNSLLSAKVKSPEVVDKSRIIVVAFGAVPFALDDDVTVVVKLPTAAFGCSSPPVAMRSVRVVVKADRSGAVQTEAGMTTAIAASGAAMALAGGGGGAALDAQALAVFSLISCSSGGDRYAMKRASFLLSPASIGPEPEGRIVFNLVVLIALVSAQGLLLGLVYAYKKYVRKSAVVNVAVIQGDLRFPSMFILVAGLLQQGTAVLSMRLVFDGLWSAAAVAGVCLSMAYPWLLFVFVWQLTRPKFEVDVSKKLAFFRYEGVSERIPARLRSVVMRYLFPVGRWGPALMRKRFGGPVGKLLPLWTSFGALEVLQRTAVCLIAALPVSGRTGCMAQFGTLVAVFIAGACAIAMLQPYRSWFLNWAQVLSSLLLGVVLVLSAILADDPANGGARSAKVGVIVLLTVLSYVRLVYGFGLMGLERFVFRRNASKTYWNECRDDPRTSDLYERLTTETGNTQFKVIGKSLSSLSAELVGAAVDGPELYSEGQSLALLTLPEKDVQGRHVDL